MALSPQIVHLLKRASEAPAAASTPAPAADSATPPESGTGIPGFINSVSSSISDWWSKPENRSLATGIGIGAGVSAAAVLAAVLVNRLRRRGF